MFRWNVMLRKLFTSPRPMQQLGKRKTRHVKPTVKLSLEIAEERIVPSAASGVELPTMSLGSPPAQPSVAAVVSTVDQWIVTLDQDLSNIVKNITQDIARTESLIIQRADQLLGIPTGGSGSGSGAAVTANNNQDQQLNAAAPKSGSGSGSGAAGTAQDNNPTHGVSKIEPLTGSGSNNATVSGQVWLDNNGDGSLDNGELGYSGATVNLDNSSGQTLQSTTTDPSGKYKFTVSTYLPGNYEILVVFPSGFWATFEIADSQINAQGYTSVFSLSRGSAVTKNAGIQSTTVTTTQDDAPYDNQTFQNLVTLRDAIDTANNGEGLHQGTTLADVQFVNPLNGGPLTGTITLKKALNPIDTSKGKYNVIGSGAGNLTIQGQGNANNPFRIFKVDAGSTTKISGLTITGGYLTSDLGGGIANYGNLTLDSDIIKNNQTTASSGGGVFNGSGTLAVQFCTITGNTAPKSFGGGIYNQGTLETYATQISGTNKAQWGGGIANSGDAGLYLDTEIFSNQATTWGGGIYNVSGTLSMTGSISGGSIHDNTAIQGGGIYVANGTLTLTGPIGVYKNQATNGNGGGIYVAGGKATVSGAKANAIYSNTATNGNGGGIYISAGTLTLKGGELIGGTNSATIGGGLYLGKASTTNFNTVTVSGNTATMKISNRSSDREK